jgi:hypothetical protein
LKNKDKIFDLPCVFACGAHSAGQSKRTANPALGVNGMEASMKPLISQRLMMDLSDAVRQALTRDGIVNVPLLAEEIRKRNEAENVALEDIESQLLIQAQAFSAAMEFDGG